jgi:simple sugar transport system ATP-binding protein
VTPSGERDRPPRLEVAELTKTFGELTACRSISLTVRACTIHAIVGENGAGKTTLMRCVAGLTSPDSGTLRFDGEPQHVGSVDAARALGIGMVHQEFSVVAELTLAENLVLGIEPTRHGVLDLLAIRAATVELEQTYGWELPWDRPAADVGVADLSRFELLRQLYRGSDIVILDEPTAVLGPGDTDRLLATMSDLRDAGRTVIFITHKLAEVLRVADEVTVLKGGAVVWSGPATETDAAALARAMVGEELVTPLIDDLRPAGRPALEASHLTVVDDLGVVRLDDVELVVGAGEIVAVYGVAGSGQRQLVEALTGLVRCRGMVRLDGEDLSSTSPSARRRAGLSYISPDRRNEGLALDEPLLANVVAGQQRRPPFSRHGLIDRSAWRERFDRVVERYGIRATGPALPARALSGGNQQRLVVGREIEAGPRALIASDPTRGVDVKGVSDIHRFIRDVRDGGGAVLLVSHELDEVLALADRVLVLLSGRIVGRLDRGDATRASIAELMTVGVAA